MYDLHDAYKLFHEGILALSEAEQIGLRINVDYIKDKKEELTNEIETLEKQFMSSSFYKDWRRSIRGSINIYSPTQLSTYLYKIKNYNILKETSSGQAATDEETLLALGIPELNILLKIKKLKKIKDTYLDNFERETVNGYMHPFFNLHLVRTYRGSSDSPNFQNIPKRDSEAMNICRRAIYPRPGHQLVEVDYKQLEVRIASCYNEDEKLIDDIIHGDMHRDMAIEIFKIKNYNNDDPTHKVLRQATKNGFVFPQFYGSTFKNCGPNLACNWGELPRKGNWKSGQGIAFENTHLADHLIKQRIKNLSEFTEHIKKVEYRFWYKRYKKYSEWKERWWTEYQHKGYFESLTGFRFSGAMVKNDVINYPVQGAAFHCLLWSLIEITKMQKKKRWKTRIVGQIHDAIVLDVHPDELHYVLKVVKRIMCDDIRKAWKWIVLPLDIDIEIHPVDGSWADKM